MIRLYKFLLGPALLWQGIRLRRSALHLPEAEGARSGVFDQQGLSPLRLLFVGDSSAAGVGVDRQHEALAHQTAELVSVALSRAVHWNLIAESGANSSDAIDLVTRHPHLPADVVIVALGVNDVTSQHSARQFIRNYSSLLHLVAERTGARAAVVSGIPPLHVLPAAPQPLRWYLGQCAKRLDVALREFAGQRRNTRYVSLAWAKASEMARDGFHPGKSQYREWAHLVAEQVLALAALPDFVDCPGSQVSRQDALEAPSCQRAS